MDVDCAHCPGAISHKIFTEVGSSIAKPCYELFHQPCERCSSSYPQKDSLCATCQHLRLKHLVNCVSLETRRRFLFHIRPHRMGANATLSCPYCRMVRHMLSHAFGENAVSTFMPNDWSTSLIFGYGSIQSYVTAAEVYRKLQVGNEHVIWKKVGDLHIADVGNITVNKPVPRIGVTVNWLRLREAINECTEEHVSCRADDHTTLPHGFRLIDVTRRCIVETTEVGFIALSYVWGKDTRASLLTATRNTIAAFRKDGGLVATNMPQTIEDAMRICAELGVNYLWADRLCIIQDDPEDKMHQIMAMNDIYESASLVLVSAYGDNMDFGIDGVSRPRSSTQYQEEVSGLRITSLVREPEESPLALWQTRGWTYQEAVCARRLLHFTNTRAYYECQTSTCHEDMYNTDTEIKYFGTYGIRLENEESRFAAFERHLENYTLRKLTFSADVYNALMGIVNLLYGSSYNESFLYGLPKVDFDRALRWFTLDGAKPVRKVQTSTLTCPSWSWAYAMVQGKQVRYQGTTFYGTLALWTVKARNAENWEVLNLRPDTEVDVDWETYMAIAAQEDCFPSSSTTELLQSTGDLTIQETFRARWPDYYSFCVDSLQNPGALQCEDPDVSNMGPGHLFTVAQTAFLRLRQLEPSHDGREILNLDNAVVGELCGDDTNLRDGTLAPDNKHHLYEFIAVSLSGLHIDLYDGEERTTKNYFDKDDMSLDMLPVVNVLLIQRRGDVAYRKALGWVYLKDWAQAVRCWETVVLE